MPLFNAGLVRLESGNIYASTMQPVPRVTNVRIEENINRANVGVLNRGKPLENRPVINYVSVDASVDYYHSDSSITQMLGICNTSGVCQAITDTKAATAGLGIRNMNVLFAPTNSAFYNAELDLKSGVLTSYSLQGSVGSPVAGNFALSFLDQSGCINTTARDSSNTAANLVKPEGISLTGIQFTGYGLTGVTIQSFSFAIGFARTAVSQLGSKFPVERPLTDVVASLQVQGFFDGLNNSITGLSVFDCGQPSVGTVGLTLSPSCGSTSPMTVTMRNPYFDSRSIDAQVGGFTTFSLSMSLPIGPNPLETSDGSVVIIN